MRYRVISCDYDGTLAHHGSVAPETVAALERMQASGRKLVLVTGRQLGDLKLVFPEVVRFDLVVVENGAVVHAPKTGETTLLAEPPPDVFVERLQSRGVSPLSVGSVIVATWRPNETAVLEVIRDLGLELHVIFNKGAVMVLPATVNKATGLTAALKRLGLSRHNAIAIGDAENDHSMLWLAECGVAVANALPMVQRRADVVTVKDHGAGVAEVIDQCLADDLASWDGRLSRHAIRLGAEREGAVATLSAFGEHVLVVGPSCTGKSITTRAVLERVLHAEYQVCVIDPEGDYEEVQGAVTLGGADRVPTPEEIMACLALAEESVVVNLLGLPLAHRPAFLRQLLPRLHAMNAELGRPHWLFVDEAHHVFPSGAPAEANEVPRTLPSTLVATTGPLHVSPALLHEITTVISTGDHAGEVLAAVLRARGEPMPDLAVPALKEGEILVFSVAKRRLQAIKLERAHGQHRRHRRKYAEGELGPDKSFYFRGPDGMENVRAANLAAFLEHAARIDDATWLFHLRRGDYGRWLRDDIKDDDLASIVDAMREDLQMSAAEGRHRLEQAIAERYALAKTLGAPR